METRKPSAHTVRYSWEVRATASPISSLRCHGPILQPFLPSPPMALSPRFFLFYSIPRQLRKRPPPPSRKIPPFSKKIRSRSRPLH